MNPTIDYIGVYVIQRRATELVRIQSTGAITFIVPTDTPFSDVEYHRSRGAAAITPQGWVFYMQDNEYHRDNGPAIRQPGILEYEYHIHGDRVSKEEYFLKYGVL